MGMILHAPPSEVSFALIMKGSESRYATIKISKMIKVVDDGRLSGTLSTLDGHETAAFEGA